MTAFATFAVVVTAAIVILLKRGAGERPAPAVEDRSALAGRSSAGLHTPSRLGRVRFVDVARYSGVRFKHFSGTKGVLTILETTGAGVAFCDYNKDGYQDIYFVNGSDIWGTQSKGKTPRNALYRNNGDSTFTDVTEESSVGDAGYGMGCVFGDYDNDGDEDVYVTNFGSNALYRNDGGGSFTDVTQLAGVGESRWGTGCVFADFDGDGDLDLYVANYVDYTLDGFPQLCEINDVMTGCPPWHYNGEPNVLYRNNGDGTFTDVTKEAGVYVARGPRRAHGLGVVCGDYDNDGDVDLYVANDSSPNWLYKNRGDCTFEQVANRAGCAYQENGDTDSGMGVDFADYDHDGWLDIFVANYQDRYNTLFHNEGGHFFKDTSLLAVLAGPSLPRLAFGAFFFDYENDGYLDIFAANGHVLNNVEKLNDIATYKQPNQLFKNNRDGTFSEISATSGGGFPLMKCSRGAAYGDYDNDGDSDVVVLNLDDTASLLRNDGGNANNFLMVETIGARSNRSAIGARVTISAAADIPPQIAEVKSGMSYISQSDHRLLFGLGKARMVGLGKVRWPSGITEEFRDVSANQLITLREGQGIIAQEPLGPGVQTAAVRQNMERLGYGE